MKTLINFYIKHQYALFLILVCLLGLTPLSWFKGKMLAGEEFYSLDYAKWGQMFSDTWFNRINWGEFSPLTPFKFQQLTFEFLNFVLQSKYNALVFWHISLFILAGATFYSFMLILFKKRYPAYFYFLCTIYYLFTPFFVNISPYLSPPRILHAILPSIFILFYYIHTNSEKKYFYILLINLILLVASPIFVNIPLGLVILILIYSYLLFHAFSKKLTIFTTIKLYIYMTLLYFLFNAWWIIPTAYKQLANIGGIKSEIEGFTVIDSTKTADVLSLFGSWAFREEIFKSGYLYFPYSIRFDTFPGVVIRYFPLIILILGIFHLLSRPLALNKLERPFTIFLLITFLVFLFLSKGTSPPFGFVYSFLYSKIPFFWMFREPYAKFLPFSAFSFSVLLVFGLDYIHTALLTTASSKVSFLVLTTVFLFITGGFIYIAYPIISGEIVWNVNDKEVRSHRIELPRGWEELIDSWKPKNGYYYTVTSLNIFDQYVWPSGYVGNPYLMLTDAYTLNPYEGYSVSDNTQRRSITAYLFKTLFENQDKFYEECARYGLSGVVLQKDLYTGNYLNSGDVVNTISELHKKHQVFNNENVSIFDCSTCDIIRVRLTNKDAVLNMTPEDFSLYHAFKFVSKPELLFSINEYTGSDFKLVEPTNIGKNTATYDFSNLPKDELIYIYGNTQKITEVLVDKKIPRLAKGAYFWEIDNENNCCSELTIKLNADVATQYTQNNKWYRTASDAVALDLSDVVDSTQVNLDSKYVYLTPLKDFDPRSDQTVKVQLGGVSNIPYGVAIVQRNQTDGALRYFASYKVPPAKFPELTLIFNGSKQNFVNTFNAPSYYLAIYGAVKVQGPENINLSPGALSLTKVNLPLVFAVKPVSQLDANTSISDYFEKGPASLYFTVESKSSSESFVHFVNSYHQDWKLIPLEIDEYNDFRNKKNTLFDNIKLYTKARNSQSSKNIEYYSNGWPIQPNEGKNYFAIVFWPALGTKILFSISMWSVFIIISISFYINFVKTKKSGELRNDL